VVLCGGEQIEQSRRIVLGAEELLDDGLGVLIQDLEVAIEVAGDRRALARYGKQRSDIVAQRQHRIQGAVDGGQQVFAGNDRRTSQAGHDLRQTGVEKLL